MQSCAIINRENIDSDDLTYIIIINSDQNNHYTAAYDFKQAVQVKRDYPMILDVKILNCSRPSDEKTRLQLEFRDAMLNYEPNVDTLLRWKSKRHPEYTQAYIRGLRAIRPLITQTEQEKFIPVTDFHLK